VILGYNSLSVYICIYIKREREEKRESYGRSIGEARGEQNLISGIIICVLASSS
jgi:hypothetical protein